ncbi:hypothetical protein OJ996_18090 [Luteolibacter sp. GHJ8]|uniref:Uncharacterized protein n=1 Tax=Luteolibacter rhizosphaerae TaxID=2989719 RepID=A0ABT3G6N0_9BACT|nr:hypothetical protein [Luteolibacter rhizosphaerae]MCW1915502.1 hypothetical protein [Luteolibacter rhizosphaerae]
MKICLLALLFCSGWAFADNGFPADRQGYKDFVSLLEKRKRSINVWFVEPTDDSWSRFEITSVQKKREKVLGLFKAGSFSDRGGEYAWLDVPFKRGIFGFIVFEENKEVLAAFRYRPVLVKENAVGFVNVEDFDPSRGLFKWGASGGFSGVILTQPIRSVMLKEE